MLHARTHAHTRTFPAHTNTRSVHMRWLAADYKARKICVALQLPVCHCVAIGQCLHWCVVTKGQKTFFFFLAFVVSKCSESSRGSFACRRPPEVILSPHGLPAPHDKVGLKLITRMFVSTLMRSLWSVLVLMPIKAADVNTTEKGKQRWLLRNISSL